MVQFKKIGAALAMFIGMNAILYVRAWNDANVIPKRGNVAHQRILHAVRQGGQAAVNETIAAAQAGNPTAAQVIAVEQANA